jgi:hypothetical protein
MQASVGARSAPAGSWLNVSLAIPLVVIGRATLRDQAPAAAGQNQTGEAFAGDGTHLAGSYWRLNKAARAGEMCVNAGGDQGRDDYGLPPVDIEVPDDARELARDVQAYHRELRSRRRRHLARRFYGPLTRDGMVLPLLAGCLALTLVAATLLTVFTARQPTAGLRPPRPATGTGSRSPGQPGAALVHTILFSGGLATPLNSLPEPVVVLALIPPGCRCLADLRKLTYAASHARALLYLVGVHDAQVTALTAHLGLGKTQALEDTNNSLPAPYRVAALTAVVVRPDGTARPVLVPDHGHGFQLDNDVRALATGGSPASPARLVPASASPASAAASSKPKPAASGAPSG